MPSAGNMIRKNPENLRLSPLVHLQAPHKWTVKAKAGL